MARLLTVLALLAVARTATAQTVCTSTSSLGLTNVSSVLNLTGVYNASANCPAACGTTCRNGCLVCSDKTYLGWYGTACATYAAWTGAVVSMNGTAQIYGNFSEFTVCSGSTVFSPAPPPSPPLPPSPPMNSQCGSVTGLGITSSTSVQTVTGKYNTSANCPSSCGSTCRYGCTVCSDNSYIGWYASTCLAQVPWQGAIINMNGTAQLYNSIPEWTACSSNTLYSTTPPPNPPPPPSPPSPPSGSVCATVGSLTSSQSALTLTGTYQPPSVCAPLCTASASNCNTNGCVVCADNTVIGFYGNTCTPAPAAGSVVTVVGMAQLYSTLPEFASCTSITSSGSNTNTTKAPPPPLPPPTVASSSPPPPPTTTTTLSAAVSLSGVSVQQFNGAAQTAFIATMATLISVLPSAISITSVTATSGSGRHLLQSGITVAFTVATSNPSTTSASITSGTQTTSFLASLNNNLSLASTGITVSGVALTVNPSTTPIAAPAPSASGAAGLAASPVFVMLASLVAALI